MNLPNDFQFSQGSLQDFVDCRRRFYLRSLIRLQWPAVQSEPMLEHERYLQQGSDFHRLAQQALLGLPLERLATSITNDELMRWWDSLCEFLPQITSASPGPGWQLYPEISLTASLVGTRLVGKYDLVAMHPQGRLRIYDWKTSRQRSKRQTLEKRLQTRLYPYLLTRAGAFLNAGSPIQPEQVEMVYWFAEHPQEPERFAYSSAAYQADEAYLTSLIETVRRLEEAEFRLTDDIRQCAYCVYRSLCNRGVAAGDLAAFDAEGNDTLPAINLDFEQIAEISY
jgi:hypothetical protein